MNYYPLFIGIGLLLFPLGLFVGAKAEESNSDTVHIFATAFAVVFVIAALLCIGAFLGQL